jgi:hypothetical protein
VLRPSGKEDIPFEPKEPIYVVEELNAVEDLLLDLVTAAEDMGIILLETPYSS